MRPIKLRVIGITGGAGAGKSTVLDFLGTLPGVRVVQADKAGHLLMEPGTEIFQKIREHFGEGILTEEGKIHRPALADMVFADPKELFWLNGVIHPAVKAWIRKEIEKAEKSGKFRLFVIEAALLIEDRYEELCEEFWYVYAEPELRRERLKASRGYSDKRIDAIFANQNPDAVFRARCQEVIDNGNCLEDTVEQVKRLLAEKRLYEGTGDMDG